MLRSTCCQQSQKVCARAVRTNARAVAGAVQNFEICSLQEVVGGSQEKHRPCTELSLYSEVKS